MTLRVRLLLGWSALLLGTVSSPAPASQAVYVDDSTCPAAGTGTSFEPFCKIQTAVCFLKAAGGGTVYVRPGIYPEAIRMFPGVSVVSTDGPDVTTIDASGKPCWTSTCSVDATTSSCSAVTFRDVNGIGSAPSDRLSGFRITGGAGTLRSFVDGTPFVAGGGIFIRNGSPTITENVIVANSLAGGGARFCYGSGIYVHAASAAAPARPVITMNVIEENVANPPSGTLGSPSRAVGAGIYVGYYAAPSIVNNAILGNTAGATNRQLQEASGGGLAIYSVVSGAVITRNLISGNLATGRAGGLALGAIFDAGSSSYRPSIVSVDSNVFDSNSSDRGGAVAGGTTRARFRSNTFYDNSASSAGGALYLEAPANPGDQATLVNNLVAFNSAYYPSSTALGGGLYVAGANPVVRFNDLFGNSPGNVAGTFTDGTYVGGSGNVSTQPGFVDTTSATLNLNLRATSALRDLGDDAEAPTTDVDGAPRIRDGNGDGIARIDLGAYERGDLDGDGIADGEDPDRDGDGVPDVADCAYGTSGVSAPPGMIGATVRVDRGSGTTIVRWSRGAQGTASSVYRGTIASLQPWSYNEACLSPETPGTQVADAQNPPAGGFFYYFVTGKNSCGESAEDRDRFGADVRPGAPCPGTI